MRTIKNDKNNIWSAKEEGEEKKEATVLEDLIKCCAVSSDGRFVFKGCFMAKLFLSCSEVSKTF